ncbi:MAG: GPW/gp25 family protein [Anaerolineae bacterium]|nr:GPW/gp25 family protein [Anaerolineae bacterium]
MPTDQSFLGTGWSFPPTFTAGGAAVELVSGVEDIHQSLQILLATRLGERVMQDDFGCDLSSLLFAEIDQDLLNSLSSLISDAILYHEPRIKLDKLNIAEDKNRQGLLLIGIEYTIRNTNSRFNMVYPFYINEATTPGVL